jgi:hypothetical protein
MWFVAAAVAKKVKVASKRRCKTAGAGGRFDVSIRSMEVGRQADSRLLRSCYG